MLSYASLIVGSLDPLGAIWGLQKPALSGLLAASWCPTWLPPGAILAATWGQQAAHKPRAALGLPRSLPGSHKAASEPPNKPPSEASKPPIGLDGTRVAFTAIVEVVVVNDSNTT